MLFSLTPLPRLSGWPPFLNNGKLLLLLGSLGLLFVLAAGSPDTAISQHRDYGGQYQDEEQEDNKLDWH